MNSEETDSKNKKTKRSYFRQKQKELAARFRALQGDPHYIAMGMSIGVFVGITPTIPFHTALAIALAFVLRGSIPAAAIGVWISNPITIPILYIASYKLGMFLIGGAASEVDKIIEIFNVLEKPIPFETKYNIISDFLKHEFKVACAMVGGGVILGIIPGIISYFVTRRMTIKFREKRAKRKERKKNK